MELKIGDIIENVFSYTMTTVKYYEVIGLKGAKTFKLQEIGEKLVSGNFMMGSSVPNPQVRLDKYAEARILNGRIKVLGSNKYAYASKFDGNAVEFCRLD